MAEWLRPGLWEVLMLSRGIEPGQILILMKSHRTLRWFQSRPQFYMAGVSQILEGVRMAEWLMPGLWEVLMLSRGIKPGQVLIPKKSI